MTRLTVRFDKSEVIPNRVCYVTDTDDAAIAIVRVQQFLARKGLNDTTIVDYHETSVVYNSDVML